MDNNTKDTILVVGFMILTLCLISLFPIYYSSRPLEQKLMTECKDICKLTNVKYYHYDNQTKNITCECK